MAIFSFPALASAQTIVVSPKADKVAVTVYRDPNGSGAMDLGWLEGFALITETRRVSLPAGEVDLRFEGVAGGLIPQSAVVSGLGDAVSEKNRDAKLLSPGTLIDAYLGQRVHLRRTSKATGKVTEQEAIVRASGNGIVVQTETGVEVLRCTGLNETLLVPHVPADLSAKPTLSVRARSDRPVEAEVTLTYLTSNFDWRAHYVATLAPDGKTLSLFAWLTLANGDETGFVNADTMAVAGRLNREQVERLEPETRSISLNCWPMQRTHQTSSGAPPPEPEYERDGDDAIFVTGSRIARRDLEAASPVTLLKAEQENLGDLKLYRIPLPVTVAANSQKQVAMIEQPAARLARLVVWQRSFDASTEEAELAEQILLFENREKDGLGLPLPAGSFTLYTTRDGQPFLLGEGRMTDRAVGEKVEVGPDTPSSVRVVQRELSRKDDIRRFEIVATNDSPVSQRFEARLDGGGKVEGANSKIVRRDGQWVWATSIPANGSRTLTFRYRAN